MQVRVDAGYNIEMRITTKPKQVESYEGDRSEPCASYTVYDALLSGNHRLVVGVTLRGFTVVGAEFSYYDERDRRISHYVACIPACVGKLVPFINELSRQSFGGTTRGICAIEWQDAILQHGVEAFVNARALALKWAEAQPDTLARMDDETVLALLLPEPGRAPTAAPAIEADEARAAPGAA